MAYKHGFIFNANTLTRNVESFITQSDERNFDQVQVKKYNEAMENGGLHEDLAFYKTIYPPSFYIDGWRAYPELIAYARRVMEFIPGSKLYGSTGFRYHPVFQSYVTENVAIKNSFHTVEGMCRIKYYSDIKVMNLEWGVNAESSMNAFAIYRETDGLPLCVIGYEPEKNMYVLFSRALDRGFGTDVDNPNAKQRTHAKSLDAIMKKVYQLVKIPSSAEVFAERLSSVGHNITLHTRALAEKANKARTHMNEMFQFGPGGTLQNDPATQRALRMIAESPEFAGTDIQHRANKFMAHFDTAMDSHNKISHWWFVHLYQDRAGKATAAYARTPQPDGMSKEGVENIIRKITNGKSMRGLVSKTAQNKFSDVLGDMTRVPMDDLPLDINLNMHTLMTVGVTEYIEGVGVRLGENLFIVEEPLNG